MNFQRTFINIVVLCIACQLSIASADEKISPSKVYGTWKLKTINNGPIQSLQFKIHSIEILADSTWRYTSEMTGTFEGMRLSGSGKWSLENNVFRYTAGSNSGVSKITLEGKSLKFSPDPVIMPNGNKPAITVYSR